MIRQDQRRWLLLLLLCQSCLFSRDEVTPRSLDLAEMGPSLGDMMDQSAAPDADEAPDLDLEDAGGDAGQDAAPDMEPCPSVAEQCALLNKQCGPVPDQRDQCDPDRELDCGACEGEDVGCQGGVCVPGCTPRDEAQICAADYRCGEHTPSECGVEVRVSCPDTCAPDKERCVEGGQCCDIEADRQKDVIPSLIAAGQCGVVRAQVCGVEEEIDLGEGCVEYAQQQNKPPSELHCVNNQCVCKPETAAELCDRMNYACGTILSITDRCGNSYTNVACNNTCNSVTQKCCVASGTCVGSITGTCP